MSTFRALPVFAIAAIAAGAWGTSRARATKPVAQSAVAPSAAASAAPPAPEEKRRGNRLPDPTLYVDGQVVGILRAPELPPSLAPRSVPTPHGPEPRYSFVDYLAALKVDVAHVRAIHVYGSRVAVIDGDELRKRAADFGFTFTNGDRGKVRVHFPGGIKTNTTIDLASQVAVYVNKVAPKWNDAATGGFLSFADGAPIGDAVPYAPQERLKGTRVYVDGALVATVKRRTLPDSVVARREDKTTFFSVAAYLASVGADPGDVKAVDLLSGDDLVVRIDGPSWRDQKPSLVFTIPAHSRGQIAMDAPGAEPGAKARISAVQIFSRATPPHRWVAPPEYVTWLAPARSDDADDEDAVNRRMP